MVDFVVMSLTKNAILRRLNFTSCPTGHTKLQKRAICLMMGFKPGYVRGNIEVGRVRRGEQIIYECEGRLK